MKKRIRYWFLMILAWLYDNEWCSLMGWTYATLYRWSAKSGYSAAVKELRKGCANDLRCGVRINSPDLFGKPVLYSYNAVFHDAWDAGYARALTLYQLMIPYSIEAENLRPLRDPTYCPQLDSLLQLVLEGMIHQAPVRYYSELSLKVDRTQTELSCAMWEEYNRYAARIQQVRAKFSQQFINTEPHIPVFVEEVSRGTSA